MGIIIGHSTRMECDKSGCKNESIPQYDQNKAIEKAYRDGWYKNPNTGETICPECRWK